MIKDLAGASVTVTDYPRLAAMCSTSQSMGLPETFDQWQDLLEKAQEEARALDLPTDPIPIDVDEFGRWSDQVGILPCLRTLRAFVIIKRYSEMAPSSIASERGAAVSRK